MRKMLKVKDVSEMLMVNPRTITNWLNKGVFPNARPANPYLNRITWLIPESDVEEFKARRLAEIAKAGV